MKEHNKDDWYLFDSGENYNFEGDVKPKYKTVISATTGSSIIDLLDSFKVKLKSEEELREEQKMKRLRILICLK
jgi:hypothetical protein